MSAASLLLLLALAAPQFAHAQQEVPKANTPTLAGGDKQISLSWTHAPGSPELHSYRIRYREKGTSTWTYADARDEPDNQNFYGYETSATIPAYEDFTMKDSTTYEVELRAGRWDDTWGGWGPWSDTAETNTSPFATLAAGNVTDDSATLTIANHTGDWYYKHTTPSSGTCSGKVAAGAGTADLAVSAGTSYTYAAYSDSGCATLLATAASFLTKPGQTTGVTVTAQVQALDVSWTALSGQTVTGYKVQWKSGNEEYNTGGRQKTVTTGSSASITGLSDSTTYTVRVTAYNDTGDGAASAESTGTTETPPDPPALTSSAVEATTATLTLANHTGDWYYKHTTPSNGACSSAVNGTTVDLSNLTGGTSYTYKAYSDSACSTELTTDATDADFTTASPTATPENNPPSAPTNLTATGGNNSVTLAWSDPSDSSITRYEYRVNHNDTGTGNFTGWSGWIALAGSGATTTSHTITGLVNGKDYRYKVRAVNPNGNGTEAPNASPWYVEASPRNVATLTASAVTDTTATITIANHSGDWYHKHTTPSNGTCSSVVSSPTTTASLSSLSGNTDYTWKAYSDSGCSTELTTDSTDAGFLTEPGQPGKPTVTAGSASGELKLTASVTGSGTISKWQYKRKVGTGSFDQNWSDISNSGSTSLTHTFTGLTDGTNYQYKVRAVNATGESAESAASTAVAPLGETLTASGRHAQLGHADHRQLVGQLVPQAHVRHRRDLLLGGHRPHQDGQPVQPGRQHRLHLEGLQRQRLHERERVGERGLPHRAGPARPAHRHGRLGQRRTEADRLGDRQRHDQQVAVQAEGGRRRLRCGLERHLQQRLGLAQPHLHRPDRRHQLPVQGARG